MKEDLREKIFILFFGTLTDLLKILKETAIGSLKISLGGVCLLTRPFSKHKSQTLMRKYSIKKIPHHLYYGLVRIPILPLSLVSGLIKPEIAIRLRSFFHFTSSKTVETYSAFRLTLRCIKTVQEKQSFLLKTLKKEEQLKNLDALIHLKNSNSQIYQFYRDVQNLVPNLQPFVKPHSLEKTLTLIKEQEKKMVEVTATLEFMEEVKKALSEKTPLENLDRVQLENSLQKFEEKMNLAIQKKPEIQSIAPKLYPSIVGNLWERINELKLKLKIFQEKGEQQQ